MSPPNRTYDFFAGHGAGGDPAGLLQLPHGMHKRARTELRTQPNRNAWLQTRAIVFNNEITMSGLIRRVAAMHLTQDGSAICRNMNQKKPARCSGRAQIISFNFVNASVRASCQA
ncbi:MAG TPA: hypothetical protein VKW08_23225 [Xanthobacteraceae bacterium]|nr:hypothetical protein [Xanthobacteraceae bacterium]